MSNKNLRKTHRDIDIDAVRADLYDFHALPPTPPVERSAFRDQLRDYEAEDDATPHPPLSSSPQQHQHPIHAKESGRNAQNCHHFHWLEDRSKQERQPIPIHHPPIVRHHSQMPHSQELLHGEIDVFGAPHAATPARIEEEEEEKIDIDLSDASDDRNHDKPHDVFVHSAPLERNLPVLAPAFRREKARDYKGRLRTWPVLLVSCLALMIITALVVYYGHQVHQDARLRSKAFQARKYLNDKLERSNRSKSPSEELIEDDGQIGNPKQYPPAACELPTYVSKNGRIVAIAANGTSVPLQLKGVNWFGMETTHNIPFGLWDNNDNGTTVYHIASFLAEHKFNAVRLPLSVDSLLKSRKPNKQMINTMSNRAISIDSTMKLLQSLIKALQFRHIGVLLSLQTLTPSDPGGLWYSSTITEAKVLQAIDSLTDALCSPTYWNVMGIDLKNKPFKATWGTGESTDFQLGATRLGNRMVQNCPQWLAFVGGVNALHNLTVGGEELQYYDWYGGGLQGAKTHPIQLTQPSKVVYAPHYYNPSVYPQPFFYNTADAKEDATGTLTGSQELSDNVLQDRVSAMMLDMFGFLTKSHRSAVVLTEFGGLYARDAHAFQTSKRVTDEVIAWVVNASSGAFLWSLNPESEYAYNPVDTMGKFNEGLMQDDWMQVNPDYLNALAPLDEMPHLQMLPCFPNASSSSSSSSSSSAARVL